VSGPQEEEGGHIDFDSKSVTCTIPDELGAQRSRICIAFVGKGADVSLRFPVVGSQDSALRTKLKG